MGEDALIVIKINVITVGNRLDISCSVKVQNMVEVEMQEYPMMKLNIPQLSLVGLENNYLIYK